jgi:hypothetical protein
MWSWRKKKMRSSRVILSVVLSLSLTLVNPGVGRAQNNQTPAARYSVTVVQEANSAKDFKNGRVSLKASALVTDQNSVPVPGIPVMFAIPQMTGTAFADGGLTSLVTTDDKGKAVSGTFITGVGKTFSMTVTTTTPSGVFTTTADITTPVKPPGGTSHKKVGIIAGVGAGAAVAVALALKGSNPTVPTGTIGAPGTATFGKP